MINTRIVIKVIAVVLEIICFIPTMAVSCAGNTKGLSVLDAMGGITNGDTTYVDPQWICIIAFIIPIDLFFGWRKKQEEDEDNTMSGMIVNAVVDIIFWIYYKNKVIEIAESYYCSAEPMGWYYFNMTLLIITLILLSCIAFKIITPEQSLAEAISLASGRIKGEGNSPPCSNYQDISQCTFLDGQTECEEEYDGYCAECGARMLKNSKYCCRCGTERE